MSLDLFVALNRKDLPSTEQWATALIEHGFPVVLEPSLDPATSNGFWPCPDSTKGFEYSVGPLTSAELSNLGISSKDQKRLRQYDLLAVLSFRTEADLAVAQAASATLSKICDGLLVEGESGALMPPEQALAWARGEYEPPCEIEFRPRPPKNRISPITWGKLALLTGLTGYWIYRWTTGH